MTRRIWYWIITTDPDSGKNFLIFGGDSEEECRSKGLEMLGGLDFQIKALPTREISAASQMWKGNRLQQTHSLKDATKRIGHNKSLKRMRQRHNR